MYACVYSGLEIGVCVYLYNNVTLTLTFLIRHVSNEFRCVFVSFSFCLDISRISLIENALICVVLLSFIDGMYTGGGV